MAKLNRLISGLLFLTVCLTVTASSYANPEGIHSCAGLPYTCEELVRLGFTYPFPRQAGSYLFINGVAFPFVKVTDRLLDDSTVRLPDSTTMRVGDLLATFKLETAADRRLIPVIGYGSNASPDQLTRKFVNANFPGSAVIPVMKGRLKDYDVVWTPLFVGYGAMPATIAPSPGTQVEVWVTWLDEKTVERMNASEGVGGLYAFGTLQGVDFELEGPKPNDLKVYVSCYGALTVEGALLAVAAVPAEGRSGRPMDSASALKAVLPKLGWKGSVLDLLYANVTSPIGRQQRTDKIKDLGIKVDDQNFVPQVPCTAGEGSEGGKM